MGLNKLNKFGSVSIFLFSFILSIHFVNAQNYGLKFNGQNATLDKRTELNLTPDKFFTFNDEFEINFDYKINRIIPNSGIGLFGYIFRKP